MRTLFTLNRSTTQDDCVITNPGDFASQEDYIPEGSHGTTRFYSPPETSSITPYLGIQARLSQIWINRWTVLLLLVLARTILAVAGLHKDIDIAKRDAMSACSKVEATGSAIVSLPHYMAEGVNDFTIDGVEKAIDGLMKILSLTITGVEEIIVFYINMLTSTYLCLITMAVSGSLQAAIALIESVQGFLNQTLSTIGNDIHNNVESFESELNKFISGLNDVGSVFGGSGNTVPTLNIGSDLTALQNVHLPSNLDQDLQQLNSSMPSFAQVKNFTDNVIRYPFEEIKSLIANSTNNYTLDRALFPVPQKKTLTFCSDNNTINDFFQDVFQITLLFRKIAIIVLLILAVACCAPMAWKEIRGWRAQQKRARLIRENDFDSMDVVYIVSRPYTAAAGLMAASRVRNDRFRTIIRWTVAYATTVPALVVLALGLAGLFSCLVQYILLKSIEKELPALTHEITSFADTIVYALGNESAQWANGTNAAIMDVNNKINHDVFGWVNISTHAVNDTLNSFVDETIKVLNETFGGTVLYEPVTDVFNCLIGLKIAGIEKGLTWVSDNAYVTFPGVPNNTFSVGASNSLQNDTSGSSLLADAANDAQDDLTRAVAWLATKLQEAIQEEAWIALALVAVWFVIVLIGISRAIILLPGRDQPIGPDGKPFATGVGGGDGSSPPPAGASRSARANFRQEKGQELVISNPRPLIADEKLGTPAPEYTLVPHPMPVPNTRITTTAPVSKAQAAPYTAPLSSDATVPRLSVLPPPDSPLGTATAAADASSSPFIQASPSRRPLIRGAAATENERGNTYRNAAYTIHPKPMPTFSETPAPASSSENKASSSSPARLRPNGSGNVQDSDGNTGSIGFVEARNVDGATTRPADLRKSSHGLVSSTTAAALAKKRRPAPPPPTTFDTLGI